MATIRKRRSRWQVQIRRNGYPAFTRSFLMRADAEAWGRQQEVALERGDIINVKRDLQALTLGQLLQREVTAENRSVDVIVCVMPNEMFDSITTTSESDDDDSAKSELEHNFRRILKAKSMHLGTPLQLVREKTIIITKQAGDQQDPATKAWNFVTALYYKGNKTIPWRRLVEDSAKLRSATSASASTRAATGRQYRRAWLRSSTKTGTGSFCAARRCRSTRRIVALT